MTIAAIRAELHQLIDVADEGKLKEIETLLKDDKVTDTYSEDELKKFYAVLAAYEAGQTETTDPATVHNTIRQKIAARK